MSLRVAFEVSCRTSDLEELCVCGSLSELGAWDTARAIPLGTSERSYPVWRSAMLLLPAKAHEAVMYKYVKLSSAAPPQWEAGPSRVLELSCLSESMLNCVEDVTLNLEEDISRRGSGARIRFEEDSSYIPKNQAASQVASAVTSRPTSSIPSPPRTSAGQTPVEKSPRGLQELEGVLRELTELEAMNLVGRADVQRAMAAVRNAIEAERSGSRFRFRRRCHCTCVCLSLLLVPLMPVIVAAVLLWRVPSARERLLRLPGVASLESIRGSWPDSTCITRVLRQAPGSGHGPAWTVHCTPAHLRHGRCRVLRA